MSYTKGPWQYGANGYSRWPFDGGYNGTITSVSGQIIYAGPASFCALRGETPEEAEANARLIAAAPELADALKWFIDDIDGTHTKMTEFAEAVEAARAALAKAGVE